MRLTRKHKVLLLVFTLISVLAVSYTGGTYAGLDRLLTGRGYLVRVESPSSGGIFVNAEVTYRGVTVGEVVAMRLDGDGVTLDLDISDDAPPIPADTDAVVANRSAVGEQYVDLRPRSDDGPFLEHGSVIRRNRTGTPVRPQDLLAGVHDLVSSVNPESLRTVVDETNKAFAGVGPQLQRLLDATNSFTATAQKNLPQTRELLRHGRVVLDTQREQGRNLRRIAAGFKKITGTLKAADPDLRTVIEGTPRLSREITGFLRDSGTSTSVLLANLLTTTRIGSVRTDALEQALVALPIVSSFSKSVSSRGEGHLGLVLNFFDPPSCTKGYEGTPRRPANETSDTPPNTEAYCAEPPGSPISVRGSQNVPVAGDPVDVPEHEAGSGDRGQGDGGTDRAELPGLLDFARTPTTTRGLDGLVGVR